MKYSTTIEAFGATWLVSTAYFAASGEETIIFATDEAGRVCDEFVRATGPHSKRIAIEALRAMTPGEVTDRADRLSECPATAQGMAHLRACVESYVISALTKEIEAFTGTVD